MNSLNKKLVRDLYTLKIQFITIGLVIAAGIAYMVASWTAYYSLVSAQETFYTKQNLQDGFAYLKKAPNSLISKFRAIEGIDFIETRVGNEVVLDFQEEVLPSAAMLLSLPESINQLSVQSGQLPETNDEIILSESFAIENQLKEGSKLIAIIHGQKVVLNVTGTALSPEFVYVFRPSNPMPDNKHYGVIWMKKSALEQALSMEASFNQVVFKMNRNHSEIKTFYEIDEILKPYGGLGAKGRNHLPSHSLLEDEFKQLRSTSIFLPGVFLAVAAFLLHIIINRLINKEREQIATLRALGYSKNSILFHYSKLITSVTLLSSSLGVILGLYLGKLMIDLYGNYYKFPDLKFEVHFFLIFIAFFVGIGSGLIGSWSSLKSITNLEPAIAMKPALPESFSSSRMDKYISKVSTELRMVLRNLFQRPFRSILTMLGLSMSVMIMILGLFIQDSMEFIIDLQFNIIQREKISLGFLSPISDSSMKDLSTMKGVLKVEAARIVPVRIHKGNYTKDSVLTGYNQKTDLRRCVDSNRKIVTLPKDGILLNQDIAAKLGIRVGDKILLEILEGAKEEKYVSIHGLISEILGQGMYMDRKSLNRLLLEGNSINQVYLNIDPTYEDSLIQEWKNTPKIAGISSKRILLKSFKDILERSMQSSSIFIILFTVIISVGVVYNIAMITLSERIYVLGSLRILGFTINEVFRILITELSFLVLLAAPIGCLFGFYLASAMMNMNDTEGFKFPMKILPSTYILAIGLTILTAVFSYIILFYKIKSMDLMNILKVRE